jgi:hypothetical protein
MEEWKPPKPAPVVDAPVFDAPVGTPWPVSIAAGLLALAGLFTAVGGVQTLAIVEVYGVFGYVPPLQIALGVGAIGTAAMLYDCRPIWATFGALLVFFMVVVGIVWNVFATMNGLFSLLTWLAVGLTMLAAVVVPFAIWPAKRTQEARLALAGGPF